MKLFKSKSLALGYLLPVLCTFAMGTAQAATGLYFGGGLGLKSNYGSIMRNAETDPNLDVKFAGVENNIAIAGEGVVGYLFAFDRFLLPLELGVGHDFKSLVHSGSAPDVAAGPWGSMGFMKPTWTARLTLSPGASIGGGFSIHTVVGIDTALGNKMGVGGFGSGTTAVPAVFNEAVTVTNYLLGYIYGAALRYEWDCFAFKLEYTMTNWLSTFTKGDGFAKEALVVAPSPSGSISNVDKPGIVSSGDSFAIGDRMLTHRLMLSAHFYPAAAM